MNLSRTEQVIASREGGLVRRWHTWPFPAQNVAEHSWGCVSLLLILHPNPRAELMRAVHFHDVEERWTGDVPFPAKRQFKELGEGLSKAEVKVRAWLGLSEPEKLSEPEQRWLRAVDLLDAWLYAKHQLHLGNRYAEAVITGIDEYMREHWAELPTECQTFVRAHQQGHIGDYVD